MNVHVPVEPFHPGEYIQDELDSRGWSQEDLARVMGRNSQLIGRLITGKTSVTPETAIELAEAFGQTPEEWMKLQSSYELAKVGKRDRDIKRRSELFARFPVREMCRRGWIGDHESVADLSIDICRMMRVASPEDEPNWRGVAARMSTGYGQFSSKQNIWLSRVRQLAEAVPATAFRDGRAADCMTEARKLANHPENTRHVPKLLADFGIRMVIVESVRAAKIQAAAMWLDDHSPVVGMSLLYDRIDNFWYNLMHELVHIKYRDNVHVDEDDGETPGADTDVEDRANSEACDILVGAEKLRSFIARHKPLYYPAKIIQFANMHAIHPGIVVGQLHKRDELDYKQQRKFLSPIRQYICGVALTDGWGFSAPLD